MQNQITADIPGGSEPTPHPAARIPDSFARILLRRKLIVIAVLAIAIASAIAYIATATKRYTSTARLSVKLADARLTGEAQPDADSASFQATQQDVILSGSVLAIGDAGPERRRSQSTARNPPRRLPRCGR